MGEPTHAELLEVAMAAAWAGGRRTLAYFNAGVAVEWKPDGSPVTPADRECEAEIRKLIATAFPGHAIVGEEEGEQAGAEPYRWIVDPLDGTRTFVRGVPFFGVLVGVEVRGAPEVGVVYLPALDEMVAAAKGRGCTWNGRACRVSAVGGLDRALLVVTDERAARQRSGAWQRLEDRAAMTRTWGDCYGYVLVATGRAEAALDPAMHLWDCAPLLPILEEAGGRFTDWEGRRTIGGRDAVGSNGLVHDALVAELSRP